MFTDQLYNKNVILYDEVKMPLILIRVVMIFMVKGPFIYRYLYIEFS